MAGMGIDQPFPWIRPVLHPGIALHPRQQLVVRECLDSWARHPVASWPYLEAFGGPG